mmetsp:Transcript_66119/g.138104  ORF Transcript_66119/g.138104 Transcript_66119/m.138104 type:complete len:384 (-) Transcript_66119:575-1726(-)
MSTMPMSLLVPRLRVGYSATACASRSRGSIMQQIATRNPAWLAAAAPASTVSQGRFQQQLLGFQAPRRHASSAAAASVVSMPSWFGGGESSSSTSAASAASTSTSSAAVGAASCNESGLGESAGALTEALPASLSAVSPASPPWFLAGLPEFLMPGSLSDASFRWIFESFVGVGPACMGVQGLVSMGIFIMPMLEALPRIRRDQNVGRLPLLPFSAMVAQGVVWTTYGLLVSNPAIWSPNILAIVLGLRYWQVYHKYCPPGANWLPFTQTHHVAGLIATILACGAACTLLDDASALTALGLLGNVMTIKMFGGPLAAMRTVIREKSTRALTLGFTLVVNLNCNLWFFYAYFMLGDLYISFQDGLGLLLTTLQMALFLRYGVHR